MTSNEKIARELLAAAKSVLRSAADSSSYRGGFKEYTRRAEELNYTFSKQTEELRKQIYALQGKMKEQTRLYNAALQKARSEVQEENKAKAIQFGVELAKEMSRMSEQKWTAQPLINADDTSILVSVKNDDGMVYYNYGADDQWRLSKSTKGGDAWFARASGSAGDVADALTAAYVDWIQSIEQRR